MSDCAPERPAYSPAEPAAIPADTHLPVLFGSRPRGWDIGSSGVALEDLTPLRQTLAARVRT